MSYTSETPFDNIESSHQYVSLLADAIEEARREVDEEIGLSMTEGESAERRKEALQIVAYNLAKLSLHIKTSGLRIGVTDWNLHLTGKVEAVALASQVGFDGVQVSLGRKPVNGKLPLDDAALQQA